MPFKNKPENTFEYFFYWAYYIHQEGHTIGLHRLIARRIYRRAFVLVLHARAIFPWPGFSMADMEGGECEQEKSL